MAGPLDGMAATIGAAMASIFANATLTRQVVASGSNPWQGGAVTPQAYPCKALIEEYSNHLRMTGAVTERDRIVMILATSIATMPEQNDVVVFNDGPHVGQSFTLSGGVSTDPARAVWTSNGQR
jgi:hypothetical protein